MFLSFRVSWQIVLGNSVPWIRKISKKFSNHFFAIVFVHIMNCKFHVWIFNVFFYQILIEILFLFHISCRSWLNYQVTSRSSGTVPVKIWVKSGFICFWRYLFSSSSGIPSWFVFICHVLYTLLCSYVLCATGIDNITLEYPVYLIILLYRLGSLGCTRWKEHIILYIAIHELLNYFAFGCS